MLGIPNPGQNVSFYDFKLKTFKREQKEGEIWQSEVKHVFDGLEPNADQWFFPRKTLYHNEQDRFTFSFKTLLV